MRKLMMISLLFGIFSIMYACAEVKAPLNPNGDSELALLMREMYEEGMLMKAGLDDGQRLKGNIDYEKILTAAATEPEKAASADYKAFAATYLDAVNKLNASDYPEYDHAYVRMVDACEDCHRALCPGPLVKIEKMKRKNFQTE